MKRRFGVALGIAVSSIAVVGLVVWAPESRAQTRQAPLTPWGHPDLQGVWTTDAEIGIPVERPVQYGEKALLSEHVTTMDPISLGRVDQIATGLIARGMNPSSAKQQALMVLDRQIGAQASVLAFSRIYFLSGLILLCALPLLLLFRTGKGRGSMGPAH